MAKRPRNPDPDGSALWGRVIATVAPLPGRPSPPVLDPGKPVPAHGRLMQVPRPVQPSPDAPRDGRGQTLDGRWERDLKRGAITPERTVDLHEHTLAGAHALVDQALDAARRDGVRVVLMVTGRARPGARENGREGSGRGAIGALIRDWLAASRHAGAIAAIRPAHPRHGGAGALYVILRRR